MIDSQSNKTTKKSNGWKGLILWLLLAIILRWQILEPRWIPSGSMIPTLQIQDKILIEKISPKLFKVFKTKIERGAIVVFRPPEQLINAGYNDNSALIKRVIGISGDEIEVSQGNLYRNGKKVDESWLNEPIAYEMESVTVPKDSLWVLGDNRNNSLDSHLWGALPKEKLIGTAVFRYWPIKKIGPIRFPHPKNN